MDLPSITPTSLEELALKGFRQLESANAEAKEEMAQNLQDSDYSKSTYANYGIGSKMDYSS